MSGGCMTAEQKALRERFDELWSHAEARQAAGNRPERHLGGAYPPPAGDGDQGMRVWLTETESIEEHQLAQKISKLQREHDAGALDRLRAKHAKRRAAV